jgi:hypothetical protein
MITDAGRLTAEEPNRLVPMVEPGWRGKLAAGRVILAATASEVTDRPPTRNTCHVSQTAWRGKPG